MGNNHDIFDKRLKKPVVYRVKGTGEDVTVEHIETYQIGKAHLTFRTPNIVAIHLSMSEKAQAGGQHLYDKIIKPQLNQPKKFDLTQEGTVELFDYFELVQTAIVLLYSAIESLVNLAIPNDYSIEEKTSRGTIEIWDKTAIERWKTTSEKLTKILPDALRIEAPTNLLYWSSFKEFEKIRNDIVHVKKESLMNQEQSQKIFAQLLNESVFKQLKAGRDLIHELGVRIPSHYEFPILNTTETLVPIEIETWESLGAERIS